MNLPRLGEKVLVKACPVEGKPGMARVRQPGRGSRLHFYEHEATPIVVARHHLRMLMQGQIELTDGQGLPPANPALLAQIEAERSRVPQDDVEAALSGRLVPKAAPTAESVTTPVDAPPVRMPPNPLEDFGDEG